MVLHGPSTQKKKARIRDDRTIPLVLLHNPRRDLYYVEELHKATYMQAMRKR